MNITDITNRWDLAQSLSSKTQISKDLFQHFFDQVLEQIASHTRIHPEIKTRIWNTIAPDKIARLHEVFLLSLCNLVFSKFSDSEIEEMLKQRISQKDFEQIMHHCKEQKLNILQSLVSEIMRQRKDWCAEIVSFLPTLAKRKKLAHLLADSQKAPEHILKSVFDETVASLKEHYSIAFQLKVWRLFLQAKLPIMKEAYSQTICTEVLNSYTDQEIEEMIKDYAANALHQDMKYTNRLTMAFVSIRVHLLNIQVVNDKALALARQWKPEIIAALGD